MGLPFGVELAAEKAGGVALKNRDYWLERRGKRVYLVPRELGKKQTAVDLTVRIDPAPPRGDGYRGQGGRQLASPPSCELSSAASGGTTMPPLRTGALEFDDAVAIEVGHPDDVSTLASVLESSAVRSAVLDLNRAGAVVRIDPGPKAWLTARFEDPAKLENVAELEQLLERLLDLHEALPAFASSGSARGTPGCGYLSLLALLTAGGMIFASLTDLSMGSRTSGLEIAAVATSPILYALFVMMGWRRLRRTGSRGMMAAVWVISLIAAPVTCIIAARLINAVGVTQRVHHRVRVLDKGFTKRLRGSDVYWVDVTPWKPNTDPITLHLAAAQHERVNKGDEVEVTLGEGRLGYEWVAEIEVVKP